MITTEDIEAISEKAIQIGLKIPYVPPDGRYVFACTSDPTDKPEERFSISAIVGETQVFILHYLNHKHYAVPIHIDKFFTMNKQDFIQYVGYARATEKAYEELLMLDSNVNDRSELHK